MLQDKSKQWTEYIGPVSQRQSSFPVAAMVTTNFFSAGDP